MIKARHHSFIYPFFQSYTLRKLSKAFKHIQLIGDFEDDGHSVLLVSNHTSWWDGFWMMYVNLKVIHRKFHFMMLEENLKKHWYFNYSGGYSVKKHSRSVLESLAYTNELLENPQNMVLMFPQGELHSMQYQELKFEQGIYHVLQKARNPIQILMVASFVEYFDAPKPRLYLYLQKAKDSAMPLEEQYNQFYRQSLEQQRQKTV